MRRGIQGGQAGRGQKGGAQTERDERWQMRLQNGAQQADEDEHSTRQAGAGAGSGAASALHGIVRRRPLALGPHFPQ